MSFTPGDETLTCVSCKEPFLFSDGEKTFFSSKNLTVAPKRCQPCRKAKRDNNANSTGYNTSGGYSSGNSYQNTQSNPVAPISPRPVVAEAAPAGRRDREPRVEEEAPRRERGRDKKKSRRDRDDDGYEY